MEAVITRPCILNGEKYVAGQMINDTVMKGIKSANLGALFATGYLSEPNPGIVQSGDVYIAGRSANFCGTDVKRGEKIDSKVLSSLQPYRLKSLIETSTIVKISSSASSKTVDSKVKPVVGKSKAETKQECTSCKKSKLLNCYNKDSKRKSGLRAKCRECESIARKKGTK